MEVAVFAALPLDALRLINTAIEFLGGFYED